MGGKWLLIYISWGMSEGKGREGFVEFLVFLRVDIKLDIT